MLRDATQPSPCPISQRILAANRWRYFSRKFAHPSELEAARETLKLLDLAVSQSSSLQNISTLMADEVIFKGAQGVASDAAALAIRAGDIRLAVSLLENGRSTIFNQLGRYRSQIEEVRGTSPELAERFMELSAHLDALVFTNESASIDDTTAK